MKNDKDKEPNKKHIEDFHMAMWEANVIKPKELSFLKYHPN